MAEERHYEAVELQRMGQRLNTRHQRRGLPGSRVVIRRRRGRAVSASVQADTFKPVERVQPAAIALMGQRAGTLSPQLVSVHRAAYSAFAPTRAQPQARIASERDRRSIPGAKTPGAHPAIGRATHSILLLLGGSDLDG